MMNRFMHRDAHNWAPNSFSSNEPYRLRFSKSVRQILYTQCEILNCGLSVDFFFLLYYSFDLKHIFISFNFAPKPKKFPFHFWSELNAISFHPKQKPIEFSLLFLTIFTRFTSDLIGFCMKNKNVFVYAVQVFLVWNVPKQTEKKIYKINRERIKQTNCLLSSKS